MKGKEIKRDNFCFVCGKENPKGMHLKFLKENGKVSARFSLPNFFQGYNNIIHGGIIALILDEAMAHLQGEEERFLTGKLSVRFLTPLLVNEEVEVSASIKEEHKRYKIATAKMVKTKTGEKVAEAEAIMFVLKESL